MLFAHLIRILWLGRLRLRGSCGANDEFLLTAAAENLRKIATGLTLAEIANYCGWSIRNAVIAIEHYATVFPSESELVLAKLNAAKERENAPEL